MNELLCLLRRLALVGGECMHRFLPLRQGEKDEKTKEES